MRLFILGEVHKDLPPIRIRNFLSEIREELMRASLQIHRNVESVEITGLVLHLDFQKLSNQLVLTWTNSGFGLQSAPAATGSFTNIPGATSPYSNSTTSAQQYFRLAVP